MKNESRNEIGIIFVVKYIKRNKERNSEVKYEMKKNKTLSYNIHKNIYI